MTTSSMLYENVESKRRALAQRMEQFSSEKTFREMLAGEIANSKRGSKERELLCYSLAPERACPLAILTCQCSLAH